MDVLHIVNIFKKLYYVVLTVVDSDYSGRNITNICQFSYFCFEYRNLELPGIPFLLVLASLSTFQEVGRAVFTFLSVGIIYDKGGVSHGTTQFIPGAAGRSITAKVWLQAGIAANAGIPLQFRSSFLLHLRLNGHFFSLLSRPGGRRSGIFLDLAYRRYWTIPGCIELC